jgi:hypothetical protein
VELGIEQVEAGTDRLAAVSDIDCRVARASIDWEDRYLVLDLMAVGETD